MDDTAVSNFLDIIHTPGSAYEIVALKCPDKRGGTFTSTHSGYFCDTIAAVSETSRLEQLSPPGIYVTFNPVQPDLLARSLNFCKSKAASRTNDTEIVSRRWIFVDIDPVRSKDISSTDFELQTALELAGSIKLDLLDEGFPEPLLCMSGNGAYLLYRVDLPNDDDTTNLVKRFLAVLAKRYDNDRVTIDPSACNAARICKLIGTTARKGSHLVDIPGVKDRPHRVTWFEQPTSPLQSVPVAALDAIAGQCELPAAVYNDSEGLLDQTRPGDDFASKVSWDEILVPAGWSRTTGNECWLRPGKTDGMQSGNTRYTSKAGRSLLVVHSGAAAPFAPGEYSKFKAYAILNCGGDLDKAAADLRSKGYGAQPASTSHLDGCGLLARQLGAAIVISKVPDDDDIDFQDVNADFPAQCLDLMPPVMREAFDYVIGTAIKPQAELTLGALIALFGAATGRKVEDDYRTRTNVMVLGIAPSGSGKEHPRQRNKEFLLHAGMEKVNAPERIGSHAGIISAVDAHPVRLFQLDEIGRLLATMRDPKVAHLYNVGTVLMQMYSSSNTIWTGDAYADLSKVKQIDQPHVCIYGSSVPESFYGSLSPENLTDGLVGRLIVFQSGATSGRRKPESMGMPWRVLETLKMWNEFQPPGGGNLDHGAPIIVRKTPEADERHENYCNAIDAKHSGEDSISATIWTRAPEKAAKLALIYACCDAGGREPVITLEAENWGIMLANYSTRIVLQAARNAVSGSRYESDLKFVFNAIQNDMTMNQLTRKTQRLKKREREEILIDLESSGAIERINEATGGRAKTLFRRRRRVV